MPLEYERLLAETYDAQYSIRRDPSGDRAFYADVAARAGGPVLEIGCGTGRLLLPIAAQGRPCTGVDPSPWMLRLLRAKAPPPWVTLVQSTMQELALPQRDFGCAIVGFRTFQHVLEVEEQLVALRRVREHLRPGGVLAMDLFDPDLARMAVLEEPEQGQAPFVWEGREIQRFVRVRRDPVRQVMQVTFRFVDEATGETIGEEAVAMRWTYRYELEHLLRRAGFVPRSWSSDYRRGPYVARGEMVVIADRS